MKRNDFRSLLVSFLSVVVLAGAWEACARLGVVDARFFPPPLAIAARLIFLCTKEGASFPADFGISLLRVLAGSAIAVPAAVAAAVWFELSAVAGAAARPWISFLYPMPKIALLPLVLMVFGLGEPSKVALVCFGTFFLVLLSTGQGIRRIMQSEYYDVALVYRIPLFTRIVHVLLRGAAPEIVNGTKMGIGYGLVMTIAAEFNASRQGVGVFLWNSWDQFRVVDVYAALLAVGTLGWLVFFAAGRLEKRFSRYD